MPSGSGGCGGNCPDDNDDGGNANDGDCSFFDFTQWRNALSQVNQLPLHPPPYTLQTLLVLLLLLLHVHIFRRPFFLFLLSDDGVMGLWMGGGGAIDSLWQGVALRCQQPRIWQWRL